MDRCNWQIPSECLTEEVSCILPLQQALSTKRVSVSKDEYGMYLKFSWQKSVHRNNVEENTYLENQELWDHIREAFKDVPLCGDLETCVVPYSTEFSKNVFLRNSSDGELLRLLRRIRSSFWNARFKRGDTRYPFENRSLYNDNEIRNGQKVSFYTRDVQLIVYAKNLEMASRKSVNEWALNQLKEQNLSVLRFEVRVTTTEKLRSVLKQATGKEWLGNITELLDPAIEAAIVQYYFLPLIQQVPPDLLVDESYATWFELGLKQGIPFRTLAQVVGFDVLRKNYPEGGLNKVVVNSTLSEEERTNQRSAWQYNKTIVKQALEGVPFVEHSQWQSRKDEIIKQLVAFEPFHFNSAYGSYLPEEETRDQAVNHC